MNSLTEEVKVKCLWQQRLQQTCSPEDKTAGIFTRLIRLWRHIKNVKDSHVLRECITTRREATGAAGNGTIRMFPSLKTSSPSVVSWDGCEQANVFFFSLVHQVTLVLVNLSSVRCCRSTVELGLIPECLNRLTGPYGCEFSPSLTFFLMLHICLVLLVAHFSLLGSHFSCCTFCRLILYTFSFTIICHTGF